MSEPRTRENKMSGANKLAGDWELHARKPWSKVKVEEFRSVEDDFEKLVELIQMRYSLSRDEAEQQVDQFCDCGPRQTEGSFDPGDGCWCGHGIPGPVFADQKAGECESGKSYGDSFQPGESFPGQARSAPGKSGHGGKGLGGPTADTGPGRHWDRPNDSSGEQGQGGQSRWARSAKSQSGQAGRWPGTTGNAGA